MLSFVQINELAANLVSQIKLILWELKSFLTFTLSFIPINLHRARWMKILYNNHSRRRPAPVTGTVFRILRVSAYNLACRTGVIFSAFFRQAKSKQEVQDMCHRERCLPPSHLFCAPHPLCASFTHNMQKQHLFCWLATRASTIVHSCFSAASKLSSQCTFTTI